MKFTIIEVQVQNAMLVNVKGQHHVVELELDS